MEREPESEKLTEQEIKRKMASIDKKRAKYYEFFSHNKWGAHENYDLMIKTGGKDIKTVTKALLDCINKIY